MGETAAEVARQVVEAAVSVIEATINEMLHEWSIQPVYTVNDVIKGTEFEPELLVGVGGGAADCLWKYRLAQLLLMQSERHWPGRL